MVLLIAIHVIACTLLIIIILIQRGRGGGLVENLSGVESMFGVKTNTFLSRTTTVLSVLFFFTCLSLAFLSAKQSKSLLERVKTQEQPVTAVAQEKTAPESSPIESTPSKTPQESPKQDTTAEELPKAEAPKTE